MEYYIKKDISDKPKVNLAYPSFENAVDHCPVGYSVFDANSRCLYTRVSEDISTCEAIPSENAPIRVINYDHDKYGYIWNQLKTHIKDKIKCLQETSDIPNMSKHLERVIEERELMRILMMMKSLENNEPIFKED